MKTKIIALVVLLLLLAVLLPKNNSRIISDTLLNVVNPIKQSYQNLRTKMENKSDSYIFQKESIKRLSAENRILKKQLLEQIHYIEEVKNIYAVLPDLQTVPVKNIDIVETISYTKLNSYSQIILTKPINLQKDKIYGLIQNGVVAGTATLYGNQLIGSLVSDTKCRFSVFIGDKKAPGIALGVENDKMVVQFIPKWYKVQEGDKVFTSGLDNIFFANIPVGVITKVDIQSSYSIAHIKTYADTLHPKAFFMINDATPTLTQDFNSSRTIFKAKPAVTATTLELNITRSTVTDMNNTSSQIDQTQEEVIEPDVPSEVVKPKKIKRSKKYKKKRKRKVKKRRKPKTNTLDLF